MRWVVLPIVVLPLAWLLGMSLSRAAPRAGDVAPAFALMDLDGRQVTSESLAGRAYLLNFWASWCLPACADEHPVLMEAHERFGDEVTFIGVLYRDSPEGARAFLDRYGDGGWTTLSDPGEGLAAAWGVTGPPESYLVDASGRVVSRHIGPLSPAALDALLSPVVAGAAALP